MSKLKEIAGIDYNATANPDEALIAKVGTAMDQDLNVSGAWGAIFEWIRELNKSFASSQLQPTQAASALATWRVVGEGLFGLSMPCEIEIPADVTALFEERQAARKARDFQKSDDIRAELQAKGWGIEDTPKGPKLKKI